jgi:hypothetical protein
LCNIDPLLGNDGEIKNETTAVARQVPARIYRSTTGSCVPYVVRSEAISRDRTISVQLVSAVQLVAEKSVN